MHRPTLLVTGLVALALLGGCASVDFDYPRTATHALTNTADTHLGRQLEGIADGHSGESGFYVLPDGIDALTARLLLAERAEASIDAQYYLVKQDIVGTTFIDYLLRAADRGVRVRLLVDDIFTGGYDAGMAGLDAHPNFEIRIFNPFARRSARFMDGITSFSRINRRMHNKSFTVDNQVTIVGGRNIADEYFGAREDAKFSDLDVAAIGPVVQDVSDMFDTYWNHERSAPLPAFARMPDDPAVELARVRRALEKNRQAVSKTVYAAAVRKKYLAFVDSTNDMFVWAPYSLAVDSPDKSFKKKADNADSITTPLRETLLAARDEVIVVSPYFVPRKAGVEAFSDVQKSGVNITIITNSLAANNQFTVHGGYAPSRKPLLMNGIGIFEVRDDADVSGSEFVAASGAKATLHTKAFIVDRRDVFIGSFNFDPRSANINTELGIIIRSGELGAQLADAITAALPEQTFEVFLNEKEQLRWRGIENGEAVVLDKEPHTTWWMRFKAGLMRLLPIRGQL